MTSLEYWENGSVIVEYGCYSDRGHGVTGQVVGLLHRWLKPIVKKTLYKAGVSRIVIERRGENQIRVTVAAGRPGMVIGRDGSGIETVKQGLEKLTGKTVNIDIKEVRRSEMDAQLTAESIAEALERRVAH